MQYRRITEEQRFIKFMQCFLKEYKVYQTNPKTEVAELFRVISNRHRLMVLFELTKAETRVSDLKLKIGVSASNLSKHLKILLLNGFIRSRKDSQTIYYTIVRDNNGNKPDCFIKLLQQH